MLFTATTSQPVAAMRARAFDRDLATFQLDANRWQSLLGIDLDTQAGTYEVSFEGLSEGRTVTTTTVLAIAPRVFGRRVLAVDDAFVNPPDAVVARIIREAAELEQLAASFNTVLDRLGSALSTQRRFMADAASDRGARGSVATGPGRRRSRRNRR